MENNMGYITEKARIFLKNDLRAFIKDIYDNYHFCKIKEVMEDWLVVEHFKGKRVGENIRLFLVDIKIFEEYREERE